MRATKTLQFSPFSEKHKSYIKNALSCKMSVAEGAIRSGKTIDHCIIAAAYLETCPDRLHLASGSTIANAKTNIGDCNGFGLEHLFRGRCRWGKFKDNECLYIFTKTGEKIVIFAGGGKSDSYKKILGNSYGLWIATEINEHYDSDDSRESFIKVAFGRQAASKCPKDLWDLNPCAPHHRIYDEYIDRYKEEFIGGYNYEHFTIADNLSIGAERRAEIESQYDKNSIWYQRDILGKRCVAEGLIYKEFADNREKYQISSVVDDLIIITVGVDFGGNGSATTFVCTGFTRGFQRVIPLVSQRLSGELNPDQLNRAFEDFIQICYGLYQKPMSVYADSAEQILIRGLRVTAERERLPISIYNARKMAINDRIRLVTKLMSLNRFFIGDKAQTVTDALCEAVWSLKHPDERLDDGTTDIDTLDALEYSIEPYFNDLSRL